jgi:hypothetical protein
MGVCEHQGPLLDPSSEIKDAGHTKVDPPDAVMWGSIAETRGEHASGRARP